MFQETWHARGERAMKIRLQSGGDGTTLVRNRLGILVGLDRPLVRRAAEHLLTEQYDEDQQKLDDVAEEEEEGEGRLKDSGPVFVRFF
jgi:hypothetical protein